MSQGALGQRIGAHITSVSDWERGDNAPSGRYVVALASEFGVPAEHFYSDDEEEEADPMVDLLSALRRFVREEVGALRLGGKEIA